MSGKRLLHRRIGQIIPVWFMISMLTVGTAFAAFQWISNMIVGPINVTEAPLTITGTFASTSYVNIGTLYTFDYTVNSGTPLGYVVVTVSSQAIQAIDDVTATCYVEQTGTLGSGGAEVAGYPKSGTNWIQFCFGNATDNGNAFNFGGTSGTIEIYLTCTHTGSYSSSLQVSSTPT